MIRKMVVNFTSNPAMRLVAGLVGMSILMLADQVMGMGAKLLLRGAQVPLTVVAQPEMAEVSIF